MMRVICFTFIVLIVRSLLVVTSISLTVIANCSLSINGQRDLIDLRQELSTFRVLILLLKENQLTLAMHVQILLRTLSTIDKFQVLLRTVLWFSIYCYEFLRLLASKINALSNRHP